jgi:hypothetical protein
LAKLFQASNLCSKASHFVDRVAATWHIDCVTHSQAMVYTTLTGVSTETAKWRDSFGAPGRRGIVGGT